MLYDSKIKFLLTILNKKLMYLTLYVTGKE